LLYGAATLNHCFDPEPRLVSERLNTLDRYLAVNVLTILNLQKMKSAKVKDGIEAAIS